MISAIVSSSVSKTVSFTNEVLHATKAIKQFDPVLKACRVVNEEISKYSVSSYCDLHIVNVTTIRNILNKFQKSTNEQTIQRKLTMRLQLTFDDDKINVSQTIYFVS